MTVQRLPDFLTTSYGEVKFAINPYLPLGGCITLLYGKTRIGKSPLTWEMARSVASGEPFLGYPVTQGRVLYLDFDTPPALVQQRLALIENPPPDFYVDFPGVQNVFQSTTQAYLRAQQATVQPLLVMINTLRKLYSGDEKDGALPSRIYAILQAIFSPAAILLVHHDKKSSGKPEESGDPDEAFSGHMAWLNDCQVGIHLIPHGGPIPGLLRLCHPKSQVSATEKPFVIQLSKNGTAIARYLAQKSSSVISLYHQLPEPMSKTERVRVISQRLNCSERTVWTYLSHLPEEPTATTEASDIHDI